MRAPEATFSVFCERDGVTAGRYRVAVHFGVGITDARRNFELVRDGEHGAGVGCSHEVETEVARGIDNVGEVAVIVVVEIEIVSTS